MNVIYVWKYFLYVPALKDYPQRNTEITNIGALVKVLTLPRHVHDMFKAVCLNKLSVLVVYLLKIIFWNNYG